jgi:UDPglucose 6-dehydrogenase
MEEASKLLPEIRLCESSYEAAQGADVLVLMTEWNQFRNLDFDQIKSALKSPVFVDLRNVYEPERMASLGFHYTSVGRQNTPPSRA